MVGVLSNDGFVGDNEVQKPKKRRKQPEKIKYNQNKKLKDTGLQKLSESCKSTFNLLVPIVHVATFD